MDRLANIGDFFRDLNYLGWQQNVKYIFLTLTFGFIFLAIFSYIKAHLLMKKHRERMVHEHARRHGAGIAAREEEKISGEFAGHEAASVKIDKNAATKIWDKIARYANSPREAEWKLAVIEGDKFVDDVLKTKGFPGESMGERLMLIKPSELSSLQDLWDAHKLRNLLVHEMDYKLRHEQALSAVRAFERVLKELGAIPQ